MLFTIASIVAGESLGPGDYTRSLDIGGRTRTYLVHLPPASDGVKPLPVVLAFHGGATNAAIMARFCGLNDKADQAGFIVVYPNGTGETERLLTWNAGNCCGYAMRHGVDDVTFTRELLDDLAKVVKVDPKRIYATGISNGGMMSYRLASELSDRIAAIASISGPMGTATCNPKRSVPVLHIHGTEDEYAPYHGGKGRRSVSRTDFYSVQHTIAAWVKADDCKPEPATETVIEDDDGMKVVRATYSEGKDGAEVVLYTIEGGGHTWPGRDPRVSFLGKSTKKFSANDVLWTFFEKHPMK